MSRFSSGLLLPLLIRFLTQLPQSWLGIHYADAIAAYPQIVVVKPFFNIGVGALSQFLVFTLMDEGWVKRPPSWQIVFERAVKSAGIGVVLVPFVFVIGYPVTFGVAGGISLDPATLLRAFLPLALLTPTWCFLGPLIFRVFICFRFYPSQMNTVFSASLFSASLDVASYEAIRQGWLG